ncbi:polyadenylate-binding protein 2-like [Argopecten irradians]|uniref:polyadenylate-binding protein 2-like n=1 Tax=Argopecten irradians TaxID=31199 RepID=UPI003717F04C
MAEKEPDFAEDSVTDFDPDAQQFEAGDGDHDVDTTSTNHDESAVEDPELEAIKARVKEMEEEAEKLKEMQNEVEKQMNITSPTTTPTTAGFPTVEEKLEADNRSVYVGNVDYGATAEELEQHFHGCGSVNRVTILCDKYTGHPKGFAYVEFADKDSVATAQALDDSLFRGRQIKVTVKRTNRPGISSTNRPPRGRGFRRGGGGFRGSPYGGYSPRPRGGRFTRYRRASYYSPY